MDEFNAGAGGMLFLFLAIWLGLKSPQGRVIFARTVCTPITDIIVSVGIAVLIGANGTGLMMNALGIGVGTGVALRLWDSATHLIYSEIHANIDQQIEIQMNKLKRS